MARLPLEMCLPGAEITDAHAHPSGSFMSAVVSVPSADGGSVTNVLRVWPLDDGDPTDIEVDRLDRGRGLSGGVHAWRPDGREFVACTKQGTVVAVSIAVAHGTIEAVAVRTLGLPAGVSWSTPQYSPDGRSIAVIGDLQMLVTHDLGSGATQTVARAADGFMVDAAWHGETATCHAWDRPEMAWTSSRILGVHAEAGIAVQQPRASTDGRSHGWISDAPGVANVAIAADDIVPETVFIDDGCEHGGPVWGPGQRTWCFGPDRTKVAYCRNEDGFGSLWVFDRVTGDRHLISRAVHGCVSWAGDVIVALRTGARTPQQIVAYDVSDVGAPVRVRAESCADPRWKTEFDAELTEPSVRFADGIPYRLYEPAGSCAGLIVWVHGGPNDQWQVTWRPRFTFWLSRGFAIAVPDHRGTTGHGRAFALELEGAWGSADADDTAAVVRDAAAHLSMPASRTVLTGGSAGGLTVLSAANRHPGICAAVVTAYPVVDLALLLEGDDPFEGHYNHVLVGDVTVSPDIDVRHLCDIPVLAFHGDRDMLVIPEHSLRLKSAVESAGGSVTVEIMEGEGHGFRDPANIAKEFTLTEEFLARHLG